jgi:WD40 repeat protein
VVFHSPTTIVTGAGDGVARIWHLPGTVLTGHSDIVNGIAFSPDGQTAVANLSPWHQFGRLLTMRAERRRTDQSGSNLTLTERDIGRL